MSSSSYGTADIKDWLACIHLEQYAYYFRFSGYHKLKDCKDLNNEDLIKIGVTPTGHRKRILHYLQTWQEFQGKAMEETQKSSKKRMNFNDSSRTDFNSSVQNYENSNLNAKTNEEKPTPKPRTIFLSEQRKRDVINHNQNWKPVYKYSEDVQNDDITSFYVQSSVPVEYTSINKTSAGESSLSCLNEYKGKMVVNEIYCLRKSETTNLPPLPDSFKHEFKKECEVPKPVGTFVKTGRCTETHISCTSNSALNTLHQPGGPDSFCSHGDTSMSNRSEQYENLAFDPMIKENESKHSSWKAESTETRLDTFSLENASNSNTSYLVSKNVAELVNRNKISPYACFYGSLNKIIEAGWLDKLSPKGNYLFQRRWVRFDGEYLSYHHNEKDVYSKGMIALSAINQVRHFGDNKFEVVTPNRTFVFRGEKEAVRRRWINTIWTALESQTRLLHKPLKSPEDKCGYLELKGLKGKIYMVLSGTKLKLSKNEQDSITGIGITCINLNIATVTDLERKSFEINTPFRNFCFTVESEKEKQEWIEAVQESIAETLSDYEVAEKIWFNESNRSCADCRAPDPEWASINLCVVICKKCAGQHKLLGSNKSKIHCLKLDTSVWSNELIELFLVIGNKHANNFWAVNVPPEEVLDFDALPEQRYNFIIKKYKERRFRKILPQVLNHEELNKALCATVQQHDVLETMSLIFSGADPMCTTEDPIYCTPYLLAQKAGQRLQMEFLYQNRLSDLTKPGSLYERNFYDDATTFRHGFLYKAVNTTKIIAEKKTKEDLNKQWCTLEGGFLSYYENDCTATPIGRIDINEVVCLALNKTEYIIGAGAVFTFEIYLQSERVFLFGAETVQSQHDWAWAINKYFIPPSFQTLAQRDYELIGRLFIKEGHNLYYWKIAWFALEESYLYFYSGEDSETEAKIYLKRLQELTISTQSDGAGKIDVLLLVEKGRTLYIHGHTKLDFTVWCSTIRKASGTNGKVLRDQQLSKNDIPVIVDSCIAFVTQYGLSYEGIYQTSGNPANVAQLLDQFRKDARNVKLRYGEHVLKDVTDVLKCFLSEIDDALLTKELYPYWISILDIPDEKERVRKYITFIKTLPQVNRTTLAALIGHLYRVQKCSNINQMHTHDLAMVFSPCLFQTKGYTSEELSVIEDLINNYVELFAIKEDKVKQMEMENSLITEWKGSLYSQAGDLIVEVYLERKEPDSCCIVKISPTMKAEELTDYVLEMKSIVSDKSDVWITFEAIENGELERPLHYSEKVLEQVLTWSSLEEPGCAYLVIKNFNDAKRYKSQQGNTKGFIKGGYVKIREMPCKLMSGNKFHDRYIILRDEKLLIYKDIKSTRPEKDISVKSIKCYFGIRKKVKPPTSWGFTIFADKQQWYLCCDGQEAQFEWMASILRVQYDGNLWPIGGIRQLPAVSKNSKAGTIALRPIQQQKSRPTEYRQLSENSEMSLATCQEGHEQNASCTLKEKAHILADCLKIKEDQATNLKNVKPKTVATCQVQSDPSHSIAYQRKINKQNQSASKSKYSPELHLPPKFLQELNAVLTKGNRTNKE
ncbi:arf-GAP with Rho-GAP domain, ANK repeat and PH domain-containing protein 2 [Erpetoichthys calabaricus]|uniref:ArfGAP with RhoGAP domain, ankyrin repeat and PH domain 2 n=1 Tax=Erpetoichthys calabaricus TaxID=27687 RepID=A0A8C4RRG0_ERPCA|nr:arf-GAP with Rho-GAP domain, ANK repeat and PH domain-containing protein 2 [Erpetoichthys calabaricus]